MKIWQLVVPVVFALLLGGCGKPTLDTSSDEAIGESVKSMTAALPEEERKEFQDSLKTVLFIGMMSQMSSAKSPDEAKTQLYERIDGKTAEEIIALAKEMAKK